MTEQGRVTVSWTAVERAWKDAGWEDVWLKLTTRQHDGMSSFRDAVAEADARNVEAADDLATQSMATTPCPGGFAVLVGPASTRDELRSWAEFFLDALQRHGISGRLGGKASLLPPKILDASEPVTPTLFARFPLPATLSEPRPTTPWDLDVAHTRRLVRTTLDWVSTRPGTTHLSQNLFTVRVEGINAQPLLERTLHEVGNAGIDVFDADNWARHAALGPRAAVIFQSVGGSWREVVDELRDLACRLPLPLDYAFVRAAHRGILGINSIDAAQSLPGIRELHVRYAPQLLDRYLPDAHGIQIVTEAHLAAARDLSGWTITEVGNGSHLVVASDLEAWYSETLPDQQTLASARADWGRALLTAEVADAHRHAQSRHMV